MSSAKRNQAAKPVLLDGNVLVALAVSTHVHHQPTVEWFATHPSVFATNPITQGALLRLLMREGVSAMDAIRVMDQLTSHPAHQFWPDEHPYTRKTLGGVMGYRQITDAYLADQARRRGGLLATWDRGLISLHADVALDMSRV